MQKIRGMTLLDWLPITKKETDLRGWDEVDIVFVTGDAYVDHPAFGAAVMICAISRNSTNREYISACQRVVWTRW